MRIIIGERLKPFSHTPGVFCPLPGSTLRVQIFPNLVRLDDLSRGEPRFLKEFPLGLRGPIQGFTAQLDLEKGNICVWGEAQQGFFRYRVFSTPEGVAFKVEKCSLVLPKVQDNHVHKPPEMDRLSLGSHKKQDWDLVCRRSDLKEIFPVWLRLGQLIPKCTFKETAGTGMLLNRCQEAIDHNENLQSVDRWLDLFHAGFEGILSPRLQDTEFQGFELPPVSEDTQDSPLALLYEGAMFIRQMLIQQQDSLIHILPSLPPEFHCGRYTNVDCGDRGTISFEWSKKTLRRLIIKPKVSKPLKFIFQKKIKSFRFRINQEEKGVFYPAGHELDLQGGKLYFLDNFRR